MAWYFDERPDLYGLVDLSDWRDCGHLHWLNVKVVDARGRKVDAVRCVKAEPGGLRVRVLHPVNNGEVSTVLGRYGERLDVVEFEAFIPGARLKFKEEREDKHPGDNYQIVISQDEYLGGDDGAHSYS